MPGMEVHREAVARRRRVGPHKRLVAVLALAALAAPATRAHESEQYTLPAGRDFADLGPQFSQAFFSAIREAVASTNAEIDAALQAGEPAARLRALQSANHMAGQVWGQLFSTYPTNELLDLGLIGPSARARYPGLITMYRPVESIYDDPLLLLDPSKPVRALFRAGTVSAGGTLFGTDKIIHFINVGRIYHLHYLAAIEAGASQAQAALDAVQATASNPLLSEDGLLGLYTTGIRSNADLAADYAGLQFYRNLTETVQLGAQPRAPMLQRDGVHWRVAADDSHTLFSAFVSPHWNEVLNPNSYLPYVGQRVREVITTRCDDVFDWYRNGHGQALGQVWFEARQRELATLHGQAYGHELPLDDPVSVARICWPDAAPSAGPAGVDDPAADGADGALHWGATLPRRDALGRDAVWWAAAAGDNTRLAALAARGAALDRPDRDGETPLHAAVRQGHSHSVGWLLAHGSDAGRAASFGVSPLLQAATSGHRGAALALLRAGADANAQDDFGRTALQEASWRGDLALAGLLLQYGADATVASHHGSDALDIAQRSGHTPLLALLRASAPVVRKLGPVDPPGAADALAASASHSEPGAAAQPATAR